MKFGVREICDVVFKAKSAVTIGGTTYAAGQPVLYIDTAKTSTLEGAATTVYATGGRGNSRLIAWEGEKILTFTVEDALLSPLSFAMLSGAGLVNASTAAPLYQHVTVDVVGSTGKEVIVTSTDLGLDANDPSAVIYFAASSPLASIYATKISSNGVALASLGDASGLNHATAAVTMNTTDASSVTISFPDYSGSLVATDIVRVDMYLKKTTSETQELQIDAENFAGYYYVEASTLFRDEATGEDFPAEVIIPKAKIQSNFTFTMASTGDPSTFTFTMDAFPATTYFSGAKKVLAAIQIVGDSLTVG